MCRDVGYCFGTLSLVFALSGCADARPPQTAAAHALSELPAITLQEGPAFHLARPSAIAESPTGDLVVSDRLLGQAFRFDRHGRLLNAIGKKGAGPGEFQSPRSFAFIGDSIVIAVDPGLHWAQRFTLGGKVVGLPVDLPFDVSMSAAAGPVVWFGGSNVEADFSLLRWDPRDGTVARLLPLPNEYRQAPLLLLLGGAVVAPDGDTLIVGFGPGNVLLRLNARTGVTVDSIPIPIRRRRGFTAPATKAVAAGDGFGVLSSASSLSNISHLSTGGLAVVFRDLTRTQTDFTSKLFITTFDRTGRPLCVDQPITQLDETAPLLSFAGDTLLVLEQPVGSDDSVRTVVRRIVVREKGACS